jgi:hypothetical protein
VKKSNFGLGRGAFLDVKSRLSTTCFVELTLVVMRVDESIVR